MRLLSAAAPVQTPPQPAAARIQEVGIPADLTRDKLREIMTFNAVALEKELKPLRKKMEGIRARQPEAQVIFGALLMLWYLLRYLLSLIFIASPILLTVFGLSARPQTAQEGTTDRWPCYALYSRLDVILAVLLPPDVITATMLSQAASFRSPASPIKRSTSHTQWKRVWGLNSGTLGMKGDESCAVRT